MPAKEIKYRSKAHSNLRAEVFFAELMLGGLSFDQLNLRNQGSFKKSFRNDIDKVTSSYNSSLLQDEMEITVNRDSIYDLLPEGLFHQTRGSSRTMTLSAMTEEHRRYKEEEKAARKFFQPLEQEFFRYSTMAEQEEQSLALAMLGGNLKNELYKFWQFRRDLPEEPLKKLSGIMPWAHFIKGNMPLTAKALALVLDKKVEAEELVIWEQQTTESLFKLGETTLGEDSIPGRKFEDPSACWNFTISSLSKKEIDQYTNQNSHARFLKQFEEIFIPLPIDINFNFVLDSQPGDQADDILGYSLIL